MESLGWLMVIGGLGWWGWQKYSPLLAQWKPIAPPPVLVAPDPQGEASEAVRCLVTYFASVGHKEGVAAARLCGSALFEEPTDAK